MWTKVKKFFKHKSKDQQFDMTSITMLGELIDAHHCGRILLKDCETLHDQRAVILQKGGELGLNNKNLSVLLKHLKQVRANILLHKTHQLRK